MSLTERILQGDRKAIARQISRLENNRSGALNILAELYPHTGRAFLVGITGAPGTGKSTLANELAKLYRRNDKTVAILSVDPTSPFSGGAILGDRIRMNDLAGDPGVFVRSMATRGSLGGLARAAADTVKIFDAAGFDIILIETVGVGQAEVEIASLAQSVVVVEAPGLGDEVQAIKAGVMEIADVFVVNKSDREGAGRTVAALRMMLDLSHNSLPRSIIHHGVLMEIASAASDSRDITATEPAWRPPICQTVATQGKGIDEVLKALSKHQAYQIASGVLAQRERDRTIFEIQQLLRERLLVDLLAQLPSEHLNQILEQVVSRQLDPYAAVDLILSGQKVSSRHNN